MKRIVFTVTNDLATDQRMIRICTSLQNNGYQVTLVGRKSAAKLPNWPFKAVRLQNFAKKGPFFYIEWNIRLLFYLLFRQFDIVCAIDLDTIIPCFWASRMKNKTRVLDSHEYFSEMKEVVTRPKIQKIWKWVEKTYLPKFKLGYTVSQSIADELKAKYGVNYSVIRNLPIFEQNPEKQFQNSHFIYQGAVNEARGLEFLIPAMAKVPSELHIYGTGNFMLKAQALVKKYNVKGKVIFKGTISPIELKAITPKYLAGVNLIEPIGKNQTMSLANKFFDYIMAGIPQISMNFPEYAKINKRHSVALLISDLTIEALAENLNQLLTNLNLYKQLAQNCVVAKTELNWQKEENLLIDFYNSIE